MPIAKGVAKVVALAKETTWGVAAPAGASRLLRRVTANFNLSKETYESAEIRQSYQTFDSRHGTRSATGSLNGELSAGSYFDLTEALVARDFAVVAPVTGLTITIAASGSDYSLTRSAGSWLTSGISPGMVTRLTSGAFAAPNLNKNLLVMTATATVLTVKVLNGSALTPEGPIATAALSVVGKTTFTPLTGHTDQSFTVEERYVDINQYERFVGLKVNNMSVSIPSNGLTTVDFSMVGKDMDRAVGTPYFTAPSAQGATGIFSGANGAVLLNGQAIALITSADFAIERATENAAVVGSNSLADVFTGKIKASGNLSIYFQDGVARDIFNNETEVSLVFALTENNLANSNVITFTFPRVKLNGFEKADGENGVIVSSPFMAFENANVSTGLLPTTVMIQDTSLN
ncbi:MAG: phage tail tube protein [Waterburya sp.]